MIPTTTTILTSLLFAFAIAAPILDDRQRKNVVRNARIPARAAQAIPPYLSDDYIYPTGFYPTASSVGYANPSGHAASSGFAPSSGYAPPSGSPSTHPPISVITAPAFTLPTLTSTTLSTSSNVSARPLETGTSSATISCAPNGALICNGLYQFGLCNWGRTVWQDVANGTACYDGRIDFATGYPAK